MKCSAQLSIICMLIDHSRDKKSQLIVEKSRSRNLFYDVLYILYLQLILNKTNFYMKYDYTEKK